ncbi:MAG: GNAT family N-acetyltransferase [Brachybacterium sp.]|nr:GNAT family N-acetyltransferase [Brachybacterium sp.]
MTEHHGSDSHPVDIIVGVPPLEDAIALYNSVGWSAYTRDTAQLKRALEGSTRVVHARRAGQLIGVARVLTDGEVIAYLQDILVRPEHQGGGMGRRLVAVALEPYAHVRQTVLLTDTDPGQRAFYAALGFTEVRDHQPPLRAFVRLR